MCVTVEAAHQDRLGRRVIPAGGGELLDGRAGTEVRHVVAELAKTMGDEMVSHGVAVARGHAEDYQPTIGTYVDGGDVRMPFLQNHADSFRGSG
jgi:hypothetical protein